MTEIKEATHDYNLGLPIITIDTTEGFVHGQVLPYSAETTQLYVHDIYIEENFRRRGAGTFLLHALTTEGRRYNPSILGGAAITPEGQAFFGHLFSVDLGVSGVFAVPFAHVEEVLAASL